MSFPCTFDGLLEILGTREIHPRLLNIPTTCREYMQYKHAVPEGQLLEVSFQELESDPLGTMRRVYDKFG